MAQSQEGLDGDKNKGLWVGIDLGTTNSAVAAWDVNKCRSKLLRLSGGLATVSSSNPHKAGRIVPSALYFQDVVSDDDLMARYDHVIAGQNALDAAFGKTNTSDALLTSFKRILGLTERDLRVINSETTDNEPSNFDNFLSGLPYETVPGDDDALGTVSGRKICARIRPRTSSDNAGGFLNVDPILASALLLRNLREAAEKYLLTNNVTVPGLDFQKTLENPTKISNCVIGCPAHYSRLQRESLKKACSLAGFDGKIHIITESTAAAMAYGLNVAGGIKLILVFDMGGGTTDVTIAKCSTSQEDGENDGFSVLVTAGNHKLGGDDMDELILTWVSEQLRNFDATDKNELRLLRRKCRRAKESLCGNGSDEPPLESIEIGYKNESITLTRVVFETIIFPLVSEAKLVVEKAMEACKTKVEHDIQIDEVVLVGGGTRVPSIRNMLSERFPPPHPPSLCYSVNPDAAVAQGAAIQAAILSGLVPHHEIRSAMMLDAIPHSIGVLVPRKGEDISGDKAKDFIVEGDFVPILLKDSSLPAKGSSSFSLNDPNQNGVTVLVFENIGNDDHSLKLQFLGEFTFHLRRLNDESIASLPNGVRTIEIGMICETDGSFIVSVYDANDPEDVAKLINYKKSLGIEHIPDDDVIEGSTSGKVTPREQLLLALGLFFVCLFYISVKIAFHPKEF